MGNVLVIGGAGFIGRRVVSALTDARYEVSVLDFVTPPGDFSHLNWITGSIADSSLVASAVNGNDAVIFLANASLPSSSLNSLSGEAIHHVAPTLQVLEICQNCGVERFVFASSGGTVYGYDSPVGGLDEKSRTAPKNGYGVSKLAIEHYLRLSGLYGPTQTISLRISNPYGQGQRAIRAQGVIAAVIEHAIHGKTMNLWGDGTVERDFIYVDDVAQAFVSGLTYSGAHPAINIGSGKATSILEVIHLVESQLGVSLNINFQEGRVIDVKKNVLDISLAKEELNWAPKTDLKVGIEKTINWWKSL